MSNTSRNSLTPFVRNNPFHAISLGVESDVLYVFGRSKGEYSSGEIQMYTGRSRSQIREVLFRLHANGLLSCRIVEGIRWFELNEAHQLAQHIKAIAKIKSLPGALHALDAVNK